MSEPGSRPSPGARAPIAVPALVLLSLLIYHQTPIFDLITAWDDGLYVLNRPEVRDWAAATWSTRLMTPAIGYPIPLPTFFYHLAWSAGEELVSAFSHLFVLAFHLLNVALAFFVTRRWLERGPALAATALWAAHPLLVESVAWATNLKVTMLGTFALVGLLAWKSFIESRDRRWGTLAVGAAILALGCRPEGAVIPALYLAACVDHGGWRELRNRSAWPAWGALAAALAFIPLAMTGHDDLIEANAPDLPPAMRLARVGAALALQLRHVVLPIDLHPGYYAEPPGVFIAAWIGLGLGLALGAWTVVSLRGGRAAAAGLTLFWAFYIPASGIYVLPRFTADTYMYLPLLGLLLAAAAEADVLIGDDSLRKRIGALVCAVVVLGAATLSLQQVDRWRDGATLWAPVIDAYPAQAQPYWIVGKTLSRQGRGTEALEVFEAGRGAFFAQRRIPLTMAEELLAAGRPADAADIAATIAVYDGLRDPAAGLLLAWLVTEHELTFDERYDAAFTAASGRVVEARPDWGRERISRFVAFLELRGMQAAARSVSQAYQ